jgi:transposase
VAGYSARSTAKAGAVPVDQAKIRIKVSGCLRSVKGAETFCAIRSYLATAARHGIGWIDALTQAAAGTPWIPETG